MSQPSLLDFVLTELDARKGSWPDISAETGLDYSWLTKVAQRKIPDPGVNRIEKLASYFRRTKALRRVG